VLAKMVATRPGHEFRLDSESLQHILVMVLPMFIFGVVGLVVIMRGTLGGTKRIVFDRRQGMVWQEARKLDPVWQGGIRLRDISSVELAPLPSRAGAVLFELSLLSPRAGGQKASLATGANRDEFRINGAELARFLNVPFTDRS